MPMAEIDVDELEELLGEGAALLDVREDDEWTDVSVAGAIHHPLATVPDVVEDLAKGQALYVMCAKGGRSAKAVEFLCGKGIEAVNVRGGIEAWIKAGKATRPGQPS